MRILAVFYAFVYYAVAYGILILLGVKKERRFMLATLPLIIVGIAWVVFGFTWNIFAGTVILMLLILAGIMVWIIKRVML